MIWRFGLLCWLTGCSLYEPIAAEPSHNASASMKSAAPWQPMAAAPPVTSSDTLLAVSQMDAAAPETQPDLSLVSSPTREVSPDPEDAGEDLEVARDAGASVSDAGAQPARDAGDVQQTTDESTRASDASLPTGEPCSREQLADGADGFLAALASRDLSRLALHPRVRYTENGAEQALGLGLWLGAPRTEFARHALDVSACSSATEAVVRDVSGRIVLGLRLRYVDAQLLEVEAHVVPRNDQYYAPEQIIPRGDDPWMQPIPSEERSSGQELARVAMDYFDSTADVRLLPPSAATCERRQNGELMPDNGSCRIPPGNRRFQQQRFEVIDETTGVVMAVTKYESFIGMYWLKVQSGTILDIEVIGGANSASTGW